jgi:hypothetical protein
MSDIVEHLCEVMHDAYEEAARKEGWETQERSRKPWADVPEENKATVRAAVRALLDEQARLEAEAVGTPLLEQIGEDPHYVWAWDKDAQEWVRAAKVL